jgi:V8-like Glu-specific endopeptidase
VISCRSEPALAAALLFVAAAAASACGVPLEPASGMAPQAVVGGSPDPSSAAVGAIVYASPLCGEPKEAADASAITCSGTLIAPRVVLTAAHCVENDDVPQALAVVFATEVTEALPEESVRVTLGRLHPAWSAGVNDIGALILAEDAPVAPMPLELSALPADLVGQTARVVGFGVDEEGKTGARKSGAVRVTSLEEGSFRIAADPGMTCGGDSGGPSFLDVDGAPRLIGITSYGDPACSTGTQMRVDVHAAFLQTIIDEAAQPPPERPPLDPTADACAMRCEAHADCPLGMACVTRPGGEKSCAAAGLEAGRFGAVCDGSDEHQLCAKAGETCRLWLPCPTPDEAKPDEGGCAVTKGGGAAGKTGAWTLVALLALSMCRRSRALAHAARVVCSRASGPRPR